MEQIGNYYNAPGMIPFNQITGLDLDIQNIFTMLHNVYHHFENGKITESAFLEKLKKPLETYEEFMKKRRNPKEFNQCLKMAKPTYLLRLNQMITKFNNLPPREKKERLILEQYTQNCEKIARGTA